jgi:hypothetical protein
MQSLFLDNEPTFEKTARRGVSLSDNPDEWPADILKEAHRQIPYLGDYEVSVVLDNQDDEQGYAFGHLAIQNKGGRPIGVTSAGVGRTLQDAMSKEAKVPLIVKESELRPLRVLVNDGDFEPLSERRLGQALFRTDMVQVSPSTPGDESLVSQLYPPNRSQHFGSLGKYSSVMAKIGSAMSTGVRDEVLESIRTNPGLLRAIDRNEAFATVVERIAEAEPLSADQVKEAVIRSLHTDVVQVQKGAGFYRVKTASAAIFNPVETKLTREEMIQHFGQEVADRATNETYTAGRTFTVEGDAGTLSKVGSFGRYKVKEADGSWREGWVFPFLLDFDGEVRDQALFTDGLNSAFQEKVAGIEAEGAVFPSGGRVHGWGSFMASSGDKAIATIPVRVTNHVKTPEEDFHLAETIDGRQVKLSTGQDVNRIEKVAGDHYALPKGMEFLPLRMNLKLSHDAGVVDVARKAASSVTVRSDGQCFSLDGDPLDKVASEHRHFIRPDDAEFMLVAMGAHPSRVKAKLAEARLGGQVDISGLRHLGSYEDQRREAIEKVAMPSIRNLPNLRVELIKEAATIEDEGTVDTILALNFITPENIGMFTENIPDFEKAASHLAELYVASQLGLKNVEESAIARAMAGMDSVITGLRSLETGGYDEE